MRRWVVVLVSCVGLLATSLTAPVMAANASLSVTVSRSSPTEFATVTAVVSGAMSRCSEFPPCTAEIYLYDENKDRFVYHSPFSGSGATIVIPDVRYNSFVRGLALIRGGPYGQYSSWVDIVDPTGPPRVDLSVLSASTTPSGGTTVDAVVTGSALGLRRRPCYYQPSCEVRLYARAGGNAVIVASTTVDHSANGVFSVRLQGTTPLEDVSHLFARVHGGNNYATRSDEVPLAEHLWQSLHGDGQAGEAGDPVNLATGNLVARDTDLAMPAPDVALSMSRTYNELDNTIGPLGVGVASPHVMRVDPITTSIGPGGSPSAPLGYDLVLGDGTQLRLDDTGALVPGIPTDLAVSSTTGGGFLVTGLDRSTITFDADGRMTSRDWPDGSQILYAYDPDGLLTSATSDTGRSLSFTWDDGFISSVTADDGRTASYVVADGSALLAEVTDPAGATTTYVHDSDGRLDQIIGPDGLTIVDNTFDSLDRVTYQTGAGVPDWQFQWPTTADPTTRLTNVADGSTTTFTHDSLGQLVAVEDPYGNTQTSGYATNGHRTSTTSRSGVQTTITQDPSGRPIAADVSGLAPASITYDTAGRIASLTTADGTTTFTYTGSDRIASTITDPTGAVTTQTVTDGLLSSTTDPDGVTTTYTYDTSDRVTGATTPAGTTSFSYTTEGWLATQTTPRGGTTSYTYDAAGRVLTRTAPEGGVTVHTYDAAGRHLSTTDPEGGVTTHTYDPATGLLASTTDPDGHLTTFTHDTAGRLTSVIRPGGATTTYAYGPLDRLLSITGPEGGITSHTYDEDGRLLTTTDPDGLVTTRTYDAAGQLASTTTPGGLVTTLTRDGAGRVIQSDRGGRVTTTSYTAQGLVARVTDPTGAVTETAHTPAGRVQSITDPLGRTTTRAYDTAGRLAGMTDPLGHTTTYGYDADGNQTSITSPEGLVTAHQFDLAGRLTSVTTPAGGITQTTYDRAGRVTQVTDPNGGVVERAYLPSGLTSTVTDPNGGVSTYTYDGRGNTTVLTDQRGSTWSWAYDLADRQVSATDPNGTVTSQRTYSAAGRPATTTDGNGHLTTTTHGADGRPATVVIDDGAGATHTTSYGYNVHGERLSVTDPAGVQTSTVDLLGRLTDLTTPDGVTISHTYDAAGQLTATTQPDGSVVTYGYDAAGRNTTITRGADQTTRTFDDDGRLLTEVMPDGATRTLSYTDGQLTGASQTVGGQTRDVALTRDAAAHVTSEVVSGSQNVTTTYTYDPAGPLTQSVRNGAATSYAYDATGNRTSLTTPSGATTSTYDPAGQLTDQTDAAGTVTFGYDLAGRRTSQTDGTGTTSYTYDLLGRLAGQTSPDGTWSWAYQPDGTLAAVTDPTGVQTSFAYDRAAVPQPLTTTSAGTTTAITRTPDGRAITAGTASQQTLSQDGWGHLLDGPATVGPAVYAPFGQHDGPHQVGLGYRGELHVGNLIHLRHRTYDPTTATFLTRDPLAGEPGRTTLTNPYHYAHNNPTTYTDPLGLTPHTDASSVLAPAAGAAGVSTSSTTTSAGPQSAACNNAITYINPREPSRSTVSPTTAKLCLGLGGAVTAVMLGIVADALEGGVPQPVPVTPDEPDTTPTPEPEPATDGANDNGDGDCSDDHVLLGFFVQGFEEKADEIGARTYQEWDRVEALLDLERLAHCGARISFWQASANLIQAGSVADIIASGRLKVSLGLLLGATETELLLLSRLGHIDRIVVV